MLNPEFQKPLEGCKMNITQEEVNLVSENPCQRFCLDFNIHFTETLLKQLLQVASETISVIFVSFFIVV